MKLVNFVLLVLAFSANPATSQSINVVSATTSSSPLASNFMNGILNSVQLSFKRMVDNIVPNFTENNQVNEAGSSFHAFQDVTLPPPFHSMLSGCPSTCFQLDAKELHDEWHVVYANENFLKMRFDAFTRLHSARDSYFIGGGNKIDDKISEIEPARNLFATIREPICAVIEVGENIRRLSPPSPSLTSYHIARVLYRSGNIDAPLISLPAHLNQTSTVKSNHMRVTMGSDERPYVVDLCPLQSNIGVYPFGTKANAAEPKYIIMTDASGVWPACQNYVILTTNRQIFVRTMNANIMTYMKQLRADDLANPLKYIACPYFRK